MVDFTHTTDGRERCRFATCDQQAAKLLACLDVEAETAICEQAMQALLDRTGGSDM